MLTVNQLHESAWEVENFISAEELAQYRSFLDSLTEKEWNVDDNTPESWRGRALTIKSMQNYEIDSLTNLIEKRVLSSFCAYSRIHQLNSILRAVPGQGMDVHRDDVEEEDKINMFGVVLYLNEDYEGGEIIYPEYGVQHKPSAGSMVVHRASTPHGVNKVTAGGVRYIITSFVKGTDATKLCIGE